MLMTVYSRAVQAAANRMLLQCSPPPRPMLYALLLLRYFQQIKRLLR